MFFAATGLDSIEPAATFWIGGDVNLGAGEGNVFQALAPALAGNPGFVNLEGPVVSEAHNKPKVFNTAAGLRGLRSLGVKIASIANNHARDAGPGGSVVTTNVLRAAGIAPAGLAAGAATVVIGGKRVVFTSHDLSGGVPASLGAELSAARASGDLLAATFHVSGTPSEKPSAALRQAVEIALAAGARVVAAHGSHRIGPVERRGNSVIAWGLGNLAFSCDCTKERAGMILEISSDGDGNLRAAVIPIRAGIRGGAAEMEPRPEKIFMRMKMMGSPSIRREGIRGWF